MNFKKILPFLLVPIITFAPMTVHADDISSVKEEITSLQTSLDALNQQSTSLNDQISEKNNEINNLETQIQEKEADSNAKKDALKIRTQSTEEFNKNTDFKDLIANSKTYENDLKKISHIIELANEDRLQISKNSIDISELKNQENNIEKEKQTLESEKANIDSQKANIESQINEKQSIVDEYNRKQEEEKKKSQTSNPNWNGSILTRSAGVNYGPSGKETYYNLNMSGVVKIMRNIGNNDEYWVRDDGCKMLGNYIMVAANLGVHPRGSLVETSLGTGIVCDTGSFASGNSTQLDIATTW